MTKNMKKKQIIAISTIIFILIIGFFLVLQKKKELTRFGQNVNNGVLSIDYLVDMDSLPIQQDSNFQNRPTLFILFNSECEACHSEVKILINQAYELKEISILLVSSESIFQIKSFAKAYNLSTFQNIRLAKAREIDLANTFKNYAYPSIFFYDKGGKFIEGHRGSVSIKKIITILNNLSIP